MKTLLILIVLNSGIGLTQTNIIAAKSHGSDLPMSSSETDNFGLPYNYKRVIKSVKYLREDCIIEMAEVTTFETLIEFDTICDHPFLQDGQIHIKRIKAMYPRNTEFIGFDDLKQKLKKEKKRLKKEQRQSKKSSGFIILLIGGGMLLTYLFFPNFKKATT